MVSDVMAVASIKQSKPIPLSRFYPEISYIPAVSYMARPLSGPLQSTESSCRKFNGSQ